MKIKTIDIQGKEWFDRVNGNSYFSAIVTLNFGMKNVKTLKLPYQYGYGEHYIQESKAVLTEHNYISGKDSEPLWMYCRDNKIILRTNKQENCLKKEMVTFGRD